MDGARAFDIAELGWQKSWLVGRRFGLCLPKFSKRRDFRLSGTLQLHYLPREKKYQVGEDRYFRDLTTSRRKRLREQQTRHTHKQSQETLQKTQFSRPTSKPEEEGQRREKTKEKKHNETPHPQLPHLRAQNLQILSRSISSPSARSRTGANRTRLESSVYQEYPSSS